MRFPVMLAVSAFVFLGAPVSAQTFGPPIPGMCLLSRPAAIGASRAGQSMQAQLKQMQASLSAQLAQQRAAIDQQRRALEARQNATAPIEYQRQLAALNQQALALDQQQNVSRRKPADSSRSTGRSMRRFRALSRARGAAWFLNATMPMAGTTPWILPRRLLRR